MMKRLGEIINVFKGEQGRMNFFLVIVWASYPLSIVFSFFFSKIPIVKDLKEFVFPLFFVLCLLFALKGFLKGNFIKVLLFYITTFLIIAFCENYASPINSRYIVNYLPAFYFTTLPFVFIGNEYKDERLFYLLFLASVFAIIIFFIYHFIINPLSEVLIDEEDQESMGLAYIFLPYLLIVVWQLLIKFSIPKLVLSVLSLGVLVLLGSRGPVLSVVSFIILYLVICKKIYTKIGWMILLVLTGVVIFIYLEQILLFLFDSAGNLGYNSRIIGMFVEGEISADNGRNFIIDRILNALNEKPLGLGLCGSEVVASGFYAHNLFLELLATFGWYIGGFICILFVILVIKGFISCQNETQRGFYLVLFCTSFIPAMFSGVFLRDSFLFMFLGYNFNLIDKKSRTRKPFAHSS